jgi:hypothetical protein
MTSASRGADRDTAFLGSPAADVVIPHGGASAIATPANSASKFKIRVRMGATYHCRAHHQIDGRPVVWLVFRIDAFSIVRFHRQFSP